MYHAKHTKPFRLIRPAAHAKPSNSGFVRAVSPVHGCGLSAGLSGFLPQRRAYCVGSLQQHGLAAKPAG